MTYRPLGPAEIRLLDILPALHSSQDNGPAGGDGIQCAFIHAKLDENTEYEALSYVWGSGTKDKVISVSGQRFAVTTQLHNALSRLRLARDSRVFWADAVCINQDDLAERGEQVALMRRIYRSATSVTVYLGDPWEGYLLALDFFRAAAEKPDHHYEPSLEPHLRVHGHDSASPLLKQNLIRFLSLPWWRRSWTVQEYALARRVTFQCGDTVLQADVVQNAYSNLRSHERTCCWDSPTVSQDATFGVCLLNAFMRMDASELARDFAGGHQPPPPAPELMTKIKFSQTWDTTEQQAAYTIGDSPPEFLEALDNFRVRECSDCRDKIYGITGLYFSDNVAEFFKQPDYRVKVEDLYTTLVHTMVRETGKLDILARARGYREPVLYLPSFVPDWSVSHPIEVDRFARLLDYDACGGRRAVWSPVEPNMARTKAVFVDKIRCCAEHHRTDANLDMALCAWAELAGLGFADHDYDARTGIFDKSAVFWRTLCGNVVRFRVKSTLQSQVLDVAEPRDRAEDAAYHAFLSWYAWATKRPTALHTPEVADFLVLFEMMNTGRRFASTERGRYGMVPVKAQEGDVVAVMPGGRSPFVLHRGKGGAYEIVGDAFFQGLMMGEGFHGVKDSDLEDVLLR